MEAVACSATAPSGLPNERPGPDLHEHLAGVLQQAASRKRQEVQRQIDSALGRAAEQKRAAAEVDTAKRAAEMDALQARAAAAMRAGMARRCRGETWAAGSDGSTAGTAASAEDLVLEARLQSAVAAAHSRRAGGAAGALELAATLAAGRPAEHFPLGDGSSVHTEIDIAQVPFPTPPMVPMDAPMYSQEDAALAEAALTPMQPLAFPMADSWDPSAEASRPGAGSVPIEISRLLPGLPEGCAGQDVHSWSPEQDWHCWMSAESSAPAVESMDWCPSSWMAWPDAATAQGPDVAQLPLDQPPGLPPPQAEPLGLPSLQGCQSTLPHFPVHCSSCGSMFTDSSAFCRRCGQKRSEDTAAPGQEEVDASAQLAAMQRVDCVPGAATTALPLAGSTTAGEHTASTASHEAASDSDSDLLAECWQDRLDM